MPHVEKIVIETLRNSEQEFLLRFSLHAASGAWPIRIAALVHSLFQSALADILHGSIASFFGQSAHFGCWGGCADDRGPLWREYFRRCYRRVHHKLDLDT